MPEFRVKDAAAWRTIKDVHLNAAGTWRNCSEVWTKNNGIWRMIFQRATKIFVNADVTNFDLFTEAGSPITAVELILEIGLGVTIGSTSTSTPAFYCSTALPLGSTLTIINKGRITGRGGNGGSAIHNSAAIFPPSAGGDALHLGCPTIIDNATGKIFAGGGGGGCTLGSTTSYGGGGGAGVNGGNAGFADVGGFAAVGTADAGGIGRRFHDVSGWEYTTRTKGGNPGEYGATYAIAGVPPGVLTYAGAAPGRAINRNGYALTILSGETAAQIKGAYD